MYSINHQSNGFYPDSNKINYNNSNIAHNMYYSSCGKEIWVNNYTYEQDQYINALHTPIYPNIYDTVHQINSPIGGKGKKHYLDNDDGVPCYKSLKTDFIKKKSDSNIQNSSMSSCLSPTTSVTSSSNNSSSDELIFESLFKAYQTGSLSKSKYRRLMANERERKRMHGLNSAFENLRSVLPSLGSNKQFSKFETLQMAKNYIAALRDLLRANQDSNNSNVQPDFANFDTAINFKNVKREKNDNRFDTDNNFNY